MANKQERRTSGMSHAMSKLRQKFGILGQDVWELFKTGAELKARTREHKDLAEKNMNQEIIWIRKTVLGNLSNLTTRTHKRHIAHY